MSTPHIEAEPGAFAELVLLPGDPLRAEHIATNYLSDVVRVNTVRNMYGFTGTYKGQPVSVMGSGMGMPSLLIYTTELVQQYGVKRVVRVGTCGSVSNKLGVGDLFLANAAGTDSNVNRIRFQGYDLGACASFELLYRVYHHALKNAIPVQVGSVFSTDIFYTADASLLETLQRFNFLGIEMESAALYALAMQEGFEALTVLTASDHLLHDESVSAEVRKNAPERTVRLVLDSLLFD